MSSEEERDRNLPPEPSPEHPEDALGERLGNTADDVTRQLRDLQDEMMPPAAPLPPVEPLSSEPLPPAPEPLVPPLASDVEAVGPEPVGSVPEGTGTGGMGGWETPTSSSVPPPPPPRDWRGSATFDPESNSDDRLLSMLAWLSLVILQLPVVSVIQLLSSETQHRPFQRHHAITSLLFFGAGIVYEILATIVFTILTTVTLGCGAICLWVIFFVPHALALYYAFQAYAGKRVELPYLSRFGRQQGWL